MLTSVYCFHKLEMFRREDIYIFFVVASCGKKINFNLPRLVDFDTSKKQKVKALRMTA